MINVRRTYGEWVSRPRDRHDAAPADLRRAKTKDASRARARPRSCVARTASSLRCRFARNTIILRLTMGRIVGGFRRRNDPRPEGNKNSMIGFGKSMTPFTEMRHRVSFGYRRTRFAGAAETKTRCNTRREGGMSHG